MYIPFYIYTEGTNVYGLLTFDGVDEGILCSICQGTCCDITLESNIKRYCKLGKWEDGVEKEVCSHITHTICMYNWIKKSKKMECPICRETPIYIRLDNIPYMYDDEPVKKIIYFDDECNLIKDVYYLLGDLKDGDHISYYKNGQIKKEMVYKKGKIVGKKKGYYESGKIKYIYTFNDLGKLDGMQKEFFENGDINGEYGYANGQHDGRSLCYFDNGNIKVEINYKTNKLNGIYKIYNYDNIITNIRYYKQGKLHGPFFIYNSKGKITLKSYYKNDIEIGIHKEVSYKNKKVVIKRYYKNKEGLLEGKYIERYDDGNMLCQVYYDNGEKIGDEFIFFKNKLLKEHNFYINGKIEGKQVSYNQDKSYSSIMCYKNGMLDGKCCTYVKMGEPLTVHYKNGELKRKKLKY